jgi:hypothetical protein
MSDYPTQGFVKAQMAAGKWPAKDGEILDIRSLSDREVKIIELYNQEEIIKQLRRIGDVLEGQTPDDEVPEKPSFLTKFRDFMDDGELNNSVSEE